MEHIIGVVDYGVSNTGSIINMLKKIGVDSVVIRTPDELDACDKIILPGVGSFDYGMTCLESNGMANGLRQKAKLQIPILGICLGMQMLGEGSEEGEKDGLGILPFYCKRFKIPSNSELRIPHMGWDLANIEQDSYLTEGLPADSRFYFVHSYYVDPYDDSIILMTCDYGIKFAAAVKTGSIIGVQFHPEKSHKFGMMLLRNFVRR